MKEGKKERFTFKTGLLQRKKPVFHHEFLESMEKKLSDTNPRSVRINEQRMLSLDSYNQGMFVGSNPDFYLPNESNEYYPLKKRNIQSPKSSFTKK